MQRAAAATIPTTIPVVLLDSRTTSTAPGDAFSLEPVGFAVGKLWKLGEDVIDGNLCLFNLSNWKDVGIWGYWSMLGFGGSLLFILPAGMFRTRSGDVVEVRRSYGEEVEPPDFIFGREPGVLLSVLDGGVLSVTNGKLV